MIDKVENLKSIDEPRITFNYFKITKLFLKTHLELFLKVYNHLLILNMNICF